MRKSPFVVAAIIATLSFAACCMLALINWAFVPHDTDPKILAKIQACEDAGGDPEYLTNGWTYEITEFQYCDMPDGDS